jgi:hypothetical protein
MFSWSMIGRNDNARRSYLNAYQDTGSDFLWDYEPDNGYSITQKFDGAFSTENNMLDDGSGNGTMVGTLSVNNGLIAGPGSGFSVISDNGGTSLNVDAFSDITDTRDNILDDGTGNMTVAGNLTLPNQNISINNGTLTVGGNALFENSITNDGEYSDTNGSSGSVGQILSSTNTATKWVSTSTLGLMSAASSSSFIQVSTSTQFTGLTAARVINIATTTATSTWEVGGNVTITAIATDVLQFQVVYTDETNTSRTVTFFPMGVTSASLAATGVYNFPITQIRVKNGSAITTSVIFTTGIGTVTYDAGASINLIANK